MAATPWLPRLPVDETQARIESLQDMASFIEELPSLAEQEDQLEASRRRVAIDRRVKKRFPLELPLTYRALDQPLLQGEGQAREISSAGIWINAPNALRVGSLVEVRIQWPTLLHQRVSMQLITVGKVVRCDAAGFAVVFRQHKFRTMGSKVLQSLWQKECEARLNRVAVPERPSAAF
jgi:hypothetical protein